jgi:hypothetical protein
MTTEEMVNEKNGTAPAQQADHRLEWTPPPRPEWVQKINEEGAVMNSRGVVPLDEESLLNSAMEATGLSDFGDDGWREPFRIFIKALEEEAQLNLMGRIRTRSEILQILEARLEIEDTYKRHPEIADEKIVQPIIIIGQGRSGTSLLQNVLSAHPDNGVLKHWEMIFPCPPPETETYETDPRIAKAHALVDQWNRVTPTFPSMHEMGGHMPFEDYQVLAMNFMSISAMDCLGQVPSYDMYAYTADMVPTLRYHERVLKLLQWKNPRKRWVLKDPLHLDRVEAILKVYPDACFAWTHRDPVRALASLVSIIGTIQWGRSDHPFSGISLEYMTDPDVSAGRFNRVIDQIESGVIPADQIHSILFKDLVADTVGSVAEMYEHFGMELTDEGRAAMERYMIEHPRDNRPPHKFGAGSPEAISRARAAFARYSEYFNVPSE